MEVFYLWDISQPIFDLYKILRNYSRSLFIQVEGTSQYIGCEINEPILIELIKANHLDMVSVLHDIPYLHSEYSSVMREASKDNG